MKISQLIKHRWRSGITSGKWNLLHKERNAKKAECATLNHSGTSYLQWTVDEEELKSILLNNSEHVAQFIKITLEHCAFIRLSVHPAALYMHAQIYIYTHTRLSVNGTLVHSVLCLGWCFVHSIFLLTQAHVAQVSSVWVVAATKSFAHSSQL